MKFRGTLYNLERGIGANNMAYRVVPVVDSMESFRFITLLKKTIEKEQGFIGMSLDTISTGIAGVIGFHKEKDYKYYMKKVKKLWKDRIRINLQLKGLDKE